MDPEPLRTLLGPGLRLTVLRVPRWDGEPAVVDTEEHDALGWFTPAEAAGLALADPAYPALLATAVGG